MKTSFRYLFATLVITTILAPRLGYAQVFQDGTFTSTSWSEVVLLSSPGATCTASQDTANGIPFPSRRTVHTYPPGWINCAHASTPSIYNPSQGAIATLTYSYDLRHYTSALGGVRYSPLVVQDNTYYYVDPGDLITIDNWSPFSGSLTAASFTKLDGPPSSRDTPDFSCNGSPIQFGYVTRNHNPSPSGTITTRSAIDNWKVTIKPEPCPMLGTDTYAAKFICGVQQDNDITHVVDAQAGRYSTKINVHNNTGITINFRKKFIQLRGGEFPTDPKQKLLETLKSDQAMEVVCRDIYKELNIIIATGQMPRYIEGFVILEVYYPPPPIASKKPEDPLDVVGVYTYKGDLPGSAATGVSIEVVVYPVKRNGHILQ